MIPKGNEQNKFCQEPGEDASLVCMQPTVNFKIDGGKKLHGTVTVNSSKNGAVALLCASLINRGKTTLKSVPKIEEVHRIIEVLRSIGTIVEWHGTSVVITPPAHFSLPSIDVDAAQRTRSIIMFTGSLIHTIPSFALPQAGGCRLGSRTVRPHVYALENFGVSITATRTAWEVTTKDLHPAEILMYESGDTATINAILAAAGIPGKSTIKYASANYQVQNLCTFLSQLGIKIDGIGTTTLVVHGKKHIKKDVVCSVTEDPTDAMFFIATALVTHSSLTIKRCPIEFIELELLVLEKMNAKYKILRRYTGEGHVKLADIQILPSRLVAPPEKIHPLPYPGLNIDNLPFFAVIATQARGTTLIHDWVYEKRALYFTELDKLGATTLLADPHRISITGPTSLRAADLICPPALRPATILLIAMLGAKGTSMLRNIYSINRGYEGLIARLSSLGARIEMLEERAF